MGKRLYNRDMTESIYKNNRDFYGYYRRLSEMWLSCYDWINMPDEIDVRFLELTLYTKGAAVFFYDEIANKYCCLPFTRQSRQDMYGIPLEREAYGLNEYRNRVNIDNSVIIYNDKLHTPCDVDIRRFAERLENIDRTIDININAQKTPLLIACDERDKLAMKNLYMQYQGNEPLIWGDKRLLDNPLQVIETQAPFIAKDLYQIKEQIWNEALTYMGISNSIESKKERLLVDEVNRGLGGVFMNRQIRYKERKNACLKINEMFNLDIDVEFSTNYLEEADSTEEEPNTEDTAMTITRTKTKTKTNAIASY